MAALPVFAGGAVRFSASCAKLRAGEQGRLACHLFRRPSPRKSREPRRVTMRQIVVARWVRASRLCVLIGPILPGAIPWDPAGEILQIPNSCGAERIGSALFATRAQSCLGQNPDLRASVRRDMSSSINEPAHADVHCHTQRQEREQHRRSTVTHEG